MSTVTSKLSLTLENRQDLTKNKNIHNQICRFYMMSVGLLALTIAATTRLFQQCWLATNSANHLAETIVENVLFIGLFCRNSVKWFLDACQDYITVPRNYAKTLMAKLHTRLNVHRRRRSELVIMVQCKKKALFKGCRCKMNEMVVAKYIGMLMFGVFLCVFFIISNFTRTHRLSCLQCLVHHGEGFSKWPTRNFRNLKYFFFFFLKLISMENCSIFQLTLTSE